MSKTTWITIYHHELILTGSALFVIGLELTGLTEHEVERCEDEALEQGHSMIHVRLRLGLVCFPVEEEPCGDGGVGRGVYAAGFAWSYRVGMRPMDHLDCY